MSGVIDKQQTTSTAPWRPTYTVNIGAGATTTYPFITCDPTGHVETEYSRIYGNPPQPATQDPYKADVHYAFSPLYEGASEDTMTKLPQYPLNLPYADGTERWYLVTYQPREDWYILNRCNKTFKILAEAYQSMENLPGGASRTKTPLPEACPLLIEVPGPEYAEKEYCFYGIYPAKAGAKILTVMRDSDEDIRVFDTVREARAALALVSTPASV